MYDFTTLRPRRDMGAEKWLGLERSGCADPNLAPLSVADMEFRTAPEITAALKEAADFGVYGYTIGDHRYRDAVCAWMDRRHGWLIEPTWILQTFGVVHGINLAVHALTSPGDGVIIQPPVYHPFQAVIEATGRTVRPNPLVRLEGGRYEMDFDGLEALVKEPATKLMLLCSPHNPVGRVWTREELSRVAKLCRDNGVVVYADEIHFDFIHAPHVHTVFASLDQDTARNCIVGTAASKSFNLAGLATANLIIPDPDLRERIRRQATGYTGEYNSYFGTVATRAAYESGEGWLDELLGVIWGNYKYCKAFLAEKFPSVVVSPLEGTYLLWADFRSLGLGAEELERFMLEQGLFLSEGYHFGSQGAGFERINLACPRACLENAMERLDRGAAKLGLPR